MPSVMLRRNGEGQLSLYVAKKDLEERVVSLEFETQEKWGGTLTLADGTAFYVEPMPEPKLPVTVKAKRL
ncbi:MAG: putative nitrogen fixation protein NifT [Thiohalomonadaceae bacterium]